MAPDKAEQPFHLDLVVALARPAEAVLKQVMALEFGEHVRTQSLAARHYLRHGEPGPASIAARMAAVMC